MSSINTTSSSSTMAGRTKDYKNKAKVLSEKTDSVISKLMPEMDWLKFNGKVKANYIKIFKEGKQSEAQLDNMRKFTYLISDDGLPQSKKRDYKIPVGDFKNGIRINLARNFEYFPPVDPELVKNVNVSNPYQVCAEVLKQYIVNNDFNTVTLHRTCQENLTHNASGTNRPEIFVLNRFIQDVDTHLPELAEMGCAGLIIAQSYADGMHLGKNIAYVRDRNGVVQWTSPSVDNVYYDMTDKYPEHGTVCGYEVFTLYRYYTCRIIAFVPGRTNFNEKYSIEIPDSFCHIPAITFGDAPLTKDPIGYYTWKRKPSERARMLLSDPNLEVMLEPVPNRWQKVASFLGNWRLHKYDIAVCAITGLSMVSTTVWAPAAAIGATTAIGYYSASYLKTMLSYQEITLALAPLVFQGKNTTLVNDIIDFYIMNPISSTGLPFGCFEITPYSVTQVPQNSPRANYTNIPELYMMYATSRNKSSTEWVTYMNATIQVTGIDTTRHERAVGCYQEMMAHYPEPISAHAPFTVKVMDRQVVKICLSGKDELRQYLLNQLSEELVASLVSNRVLGNCVQCKVTKETLLDEMIFAWMEKMGEVKILYTELETPNVDKYHNKCPRKEKRYRAAAARADIVWTDALYDLFIKLECLAEKAIQTKGGRIISPNTPEFNVLVMNFFEEAERIMYEWTDQRDGVRVFAKGRTYDERMTDIGKILTEGKWKYVIPIDCKNFDGHIVSTVATTEILFFNWLGLDSVICEKLRHCRVTGVASYDYPTRKSGDMFTAFGNCFLMYTFLRPFFDRIRIYCDGDDTLLFMSDTAVFDDILQHFNDRGIELGQSEVIEIDWTRNLPKYVLPFCQMFYSYDVYDNDHERMMNKLCNIAVTMNFDAITIKIIGKLQATDVLFNMGYKFDIDPRIFFRNFEKTWWQNEKTKCSKGTLYMARSNLHEINFRDPSSGLMGLIVRRLDKDRTWFEQEGNGEKKCRYVKKIVRKIVEEQYHYQCSINPKVASALDRCERMVNTKGVKAFTPTYSHMLRKRIAEFYKTDVLSLPFEIFDPKTVCSHERPKLINVTYPAVYGWTDNDIPPLTDADVAYSEEYNPDSWINDYVSGGWRCPSSPTYTPQSPSETAEDEASTSAADQSGVDNNSDNSRDDNKKTDENGTAVSGETVTLMMIPKFHYLFVPNKKISSQKDDPMSIDSVPPIDRMSIDDEDVPMDVDSPTSAIGSVVANMPLADFWDLCRFVDNVMRSCVRCQSPVPISIEERKRYFGSASNSSVLVDEQAVNPEGAKSSHAS